MTLLFCLVHAAALAVPAVQPPASEVQPAPALCVDSGFEILLAEWEKARKDHKAELKEARKHGNSAEVKARHPAKAFFPRFGELVDKGEGRALLWMAENADDAFDGKDKISEIKLDLWTRVVKEHADSEWAESIPPSLARQKRYLGSDHLRSLLQNLGEGSGNPEVAAESFSRLASLLDKRKSTPQEKARAKELRERILRDYPTSFAAIDLDPDAYREKYLAIGKVAPDFTSEDVDGTEFNLSDYRGKVVMLDFWGFW